MLIINRKRRKRYQVGMTMAFELMIQFQEDEAKRKKRKIRNRSVAMKNLPKLKKKKGKVNRNWLRQTQGLPQTGRSEDNKMFPEERQ